MSLRQNNSEVELAGENTEWAERSEFWRTLEPKKGRGQPRKFKYREPLILCGHGIRLRVDHNTLLIRNGLTHYPQKAEEIRYFPGDPNLPDRIVILDGSGGISFDALNWIAEQRIEFIRLDWRGSASSIGGKSGYSANPQLAWAQQGIRGTKRQIEIARWLIASKFEASISTLKNAIPKSGIREIAIVRIQRQIAEIRNPRNSISMSRLLGIEGHCAGAYFEAWHGIPLNWTGSRRKPIPPYWSEISPRSMVWRRRARNARHPINAMLNYGYGILANQVRSAVVASGLDPSIGIIHGNSQNPNPLVYDLMEPLRPSVDAAILVFSQSHKFASGDFTINKWGGCRLNPELARCVTRHIGTLTDQLLVISKFVTQLRSAQHR
jgi:CRISP-associated protein Cas1